MKSFYEGQRVSVKMGDQTVYLGVVTGFGHGNGNPGLLIKFDEAGCNLIDESRVMAVGNVCETNSHKMHILHLNEIMHQFRHQKEWE